MKLLRRTWHVVSIVALLLGGPLCALAQSSRPSEPKQDEAAAKRQQDAVDQLRAITGQLGAIREKQAETEARAAAYEAKQGDGVYWPPIWSNWVLAFFAAAAALIAAKSLGAIKKQAVETEKAANAAERAVLYAHRPQLVLRHILAKGIEAGIINDRVYNAKAWIVNTGPMPVTFLGLHAQWLIRGRLPLSNPALAVELGDTESTTMEPGHVIQRPLPDYKIDSIIDHAKWWSDASDKSPDGYRIFLIGFIKYGDSIGLRRRYFAYRYSPRRRRFVLLKHPNYNYED